MAASAVHKNRKGNSMKIEYQKGRPGKRHGLLVAGGCFLFSLVSGLTADAWYLYWGSGMLGGMGVVLLMVVHEASKTEQPKK